MGQPKASEIESDSEQAYKDSCDRNMVEGRIGINKRRYGLNLISSTRTKAGLSVICKRDDNIYPLKQKVSDKEFDAINIRKMGPFYEWNYVIFPADNRV